MPETWTDAELLQKAGEGDESAFQFLYQRHRDPVFRFAYRLSGCAESAADITHDCFLSLLCNPRRFDPRRASLRTYLYAAARNLALKNHRLRERHEEDLDDVVDSTPGASAAEPLRTLLDRELASAVSTAVASLDTLQREALILFEYEELSLAEIAAVVSAEVGTVKSRIQRARSRLRKTLGPYLERRACRSEEECRS